MKKLSQIKKLLYIASWALFIPIYVLLFLIGLPVTYLMVKRDHQSSHWPKWAWLWGNDEEGYPVWAAQRNIEPWHWYAIRNPVNNLRYVFKDREANWSGNWTSEVMEARELLENNTDKAYRWAWNGLFAGFRIVWLNGYWEQMINGELDCGADSYNEFWIGWKVGSTVPGMGFTLQLRLKREIGK